MNIADVDIERILEETLADHSISRSERRALREVLQDMDLDDQGRAFVRNRAFALAERTLREPDPDRGSRPGGQRALAVLDWLHDVVKIVGATAEPVRRRRSEAFFSPNDDCPPRIAALLAAARSRVDICVFTITDDRITRAILDAHRRGVRVRVITDDEKAFDRGSDVHKLEDAGVPVRIDRSPAHMHHKFALFDRTTLLTGSYNWTRSAANANQENLVVVDNPELIDAFQGEFDRLWEAFSR